MYAGYLGAMISKLTTWYTNTVAMYIQMSSDN